MENEENIVIYKKKINIVSIILILFAIFMVIAQIDMIKGLYSYEIDTKIIVDTIVAFIIAVCIGSFGIYLQIKEIKKIKNIFDIKENGRIIKGEVINIIRERHIRDENSNGYTTKFIIKFRDVNMEDKYIMTQVLPNRFDYIEVFEKMSDLTSEDIIPLEITEYFGNGYITFNEDDDVPNVRFKFNNIYLNGEKLDFKGKYGISYKGKIIKNNYKGHITCNVYEKDGRYVIDDYKGVEITNENNWFDNLMIIVFILMAVAVVYFSIKK